MPPINADANQQSADKDKPVTEHGSKQMAHSSLPARRYQHSPADQQHQDGYANNAEKKIDVHAGSFDLLSVALVRGLVLRLRGLR